MDRIKTLAFLRSNQLASEAEIKSLESLTDKDKIKAWTDRNGLDLKTPEGGEFDLAGALMTRKMVTVSVSADAGEQVQVVDNSAPMETEAADTEPMDQDKEDKPMPKSSRASGRKAVPQFGGGKPMGELAAEDRRYTKAVSAGRLVRVPGMGSQKAAFDSGDQARAFASYMRLHLAKSDYKFAARMAHREAEDRDIVKSYMGTKTLVSYDNELGGALISPEFETNIIEIRSRYGAMERAIGATPMSKPQVFVPRTLSDFAFADITEGNAITPQNKPVSGLVELNARKQGGAVAVSNDLMDDSDIGVADYIARSIKQGRDIYLDEWFIDGKNGDNGMRDLLVNAGVDYYDSGVGTSWTSSTAAIAESWFGLIPTAAQQIKIVCSRPFFSQALRTIGMSSGGATPSDYLGSSNTQDPNADGTYTGYDVYITDAMPKTATDSTIAAIAGDFPNAAKMGIRKGLAIDVDTSVGFLSDVTYVRAIQRTAKNLHNVGGTDTEGDQTLVVGWYN